MILISRLSTRGEVFFKSLQGVCSVRWIARKSEFRTNPVYSVLSLLREFFHLLRACKSSREGGRPTVIVHSIGPDAIPAIAIRRLTGCRVMLYALGPEVRSGMGLAQRTLVRWAAKNSDSVLCGSSRIEEDVRRLGGTATRILPGPFVPFRLKVNEHKEFDVVTAGNLTEETKQSVLVEACAYLDPSLRIVIVGEGPQREYLSTLSRRHGQNQVRFFSNLSPNGLYHVLRSSKLYVQCSPDDASVSSALDATCYGLPVIALDAVGSLDLIQQYGLRPVVPRDHKAISLAETIGGAIENYPELLAGVSKNIEALESYSKSWPSLAFAAIFS